MFAAGTIQWGWGLDGFGGNGIVNTGVQRVTDNILSRSRPVPAAAVAGRNPPGAPTGVSGAPGDSTAALTWTVPASDGGNPITGYRITPFLGATALTPISTGSASTSFTVTGLSNGSAYTFTVAAVNAAGAGPDSAPSSPVTPVGLPGAPTGVTGVAGDTSAALTWSAPASTGGSPVTGYRITPSQGGTALAPIPTGSASTSFTVTGLTNGTAYTFTVAAITSAGTGQDSSPSAAVTPGTSVAGAPTAVSGTPADSSVALTWTAPASDGGSAITGYRITPFLGPTALAPISTGSASTSFTVTGLSNGSAYTFTVAAVNAAGTGPDSAPSSPVTPVGLPGAPTGVSGVAGNGSVALSWSAPAATGGSPVTGYRITPSQGGTVQTPILTGSAATAFTVTGLTNWTAYTFTVAAITAVGTGPDSTSSAAVTPGSPPGAPTGVSGTAGDSSVALSWTAPSSDGGSAITGYRITPFLGPTALAPISTGSTSTSFTITGLSNGSAYTFTVAAVNAAGAGPDSAPSSPVTPVGLPGAPTGVSGVAGDSSVTLSWAAPASTGGSPITGYRITPSQGGTALSPIATGSAGTTFTVTGLTNGTAYTFTVAAITAVGSGPDSTPSAALTPLALAGAPTGVSGTAGNASVALSWTAPGSNGGSAITRYRITPYIGTTAQTAVQTTTAATSFTVTGLTNGTAYTFTVAAVTAVGTGPDSSPSAAVTPATTPGAPTGVTGTAGNTSVALTWTAPASTGGSPVTGYRITPRISGVAQTPVLTGSAGTSFNVTGLTNGTAYTFVVAAINAAGTGPNSSASSSITPATVPGAPTAVSGTSGNASVRLTWTAPSSNGGRSISGYRVTPFVGTTAQTPVLTGSTSTSFTVNGLTNGTAYTFTVAAINAMGTGADSSPSAPVTPVVPVRLVQSRTQTPSISLTPAGSFTNTVNKRDTLVGAFGLGGAGLVTVTSVTDSQGNTWTRAASGNGDTFGDDAEIWYATAGSNGADTVTLHLSGAVRTNVTLAEFSASATLDGISTASQSAATSHTSASTPPARGGDFVVGLYVDAGANTTLSITDGKTVLGQSVGRTP